MHKIGINLFVPKPRPMKILLSSKQPADQLILNEYISNQFIMAVMNLDQSIIKSLLSPHRKFLGRLNSWETMYWFRKKFELTKGESFRISFRKGISLDYYPGSEYFEFRFVFLDEFRDFENTFEEVEEATDREKFDFNIRVVPIFENGKIVDLRVPKRILEISQILHNSLMN